MMMRVAGCRGRFAFAAAVLCSVIFPACCRSLDMLKNKEVSTHREISDGLISGDSLHFLCDYVLSEPGSTIIPMYMHSPGKTYCDAVHLYSADLVSNTIAHHTALKPTSSHVGRGSVRGARWAVKGSAVYVLYHTGWSDAGAAMIHDLFEFKPDTGSSREITGPEKDALIERLFPERTGPSTPDNPILSSSRVRYLTARISDEAWRLPLPTDFVGLSERDCIRILVEQRGDRHFRWAALKKLAPALTERTARDLITSMEKHRSTLPGHQRRVYGPLMEEWSVRIDMLAGYNNADTAGRKVRAMDAGSVDPGGRTPLMIAAYFNDTAAIENLIRRGAPIDARDTLGRTALMYAIFGEAPSAMELLMKSGARSEAETLSGWTAWMFASGTDLREGYLRLKDR